MRTALYPHISTKQSAAISATQLAKFAVTALHFLAQCHSLCKIMNSLWVV